MAPCEPWKPDGLGFRVWNRKKPGAVFCKQAANAFPILHPFYEEAPTGLHGSYWKSFMTLGTLNLGNCDVQPYKGHTGIKSNSPGGRVGCGSLCVCVCVCVCAVFLLVLRREYGNRIRI